MFSSKIRLGWAGPGFDGFWPNVSWPVGLEALDISWLDTLRLVVL
jgi:hypothetical protein